MFHRVARRCMFPLSLPSSEDWQTESLPSWTPFPMWHNATLPYSRPGLDHSGYRLHFTDDLISPRLAPANSLRGFARRFQRPGWGWWLKLQLVARRHWPIVAGEGGRWKVGWRELDNTPSFARRFSRCSGAVVLGASVASLLPTDLTQKAISYGAHFGLHVS